jgi:hypothetical protein
MRWHLGVLAPRNRPPPWPKWLLFCGHGVGHSRCTMHLGLPGVDAFVVHGRRLRELSNFATGMNFQPSALIKQYLSEL